MFKNLQSGGLLNQKVRAFGEARKGLWVLGGGTGNGPRAKQKFQVQKRIAKLIEMSLAYCCSTSSKAKEKNHVVN